MSMPVCPKCGREHAEDGPILTFKCGSYKRRFSAELMSQSDACQVRQLQQQIEEAKEESSRYFDVACGLSDTTIALLNAMEAGPTSPGWRAAIDDARRCIKATLSEFEAALTTPTRTETGE
jgi:hypothetical protein